MPWLRKRRRLLEGALEAQLSKTVVVFHLVTSAQNVTRSGIEGFNDGVNCSILFLGLSRGRPLYNSLQWAF